MGRIFEQTFSPKNRICGQHVHDKVFNMANQGNANQIHNEISLYICHSEVKVVQSCPTLCDPMDYMVHGILQARILDWVSPGDLPNPGIEPRSPALQEDSLPTKPQGKPKNTGEGSLSLLQQIFLPQESNQGLLHCRRILYQLS